MKKTENLVIKISAEEIRNIVNSYEPDQLTDSEEGYNTKMAMKELDQADRIIYCLYLELGTKTAVAEVLGISRISTTRIIKQIETEIRNKLNKP